MLYMSTMSELRGGKRQTQINMKSTKWSETQTADTTTKLEDDDEMNNLEKRVEFEH